MYENNELDLLIVVNAKLPLRCRNIFLTLKTEALANNPSVHNRGFLVFLQK